MRTDWRGVRHYVRSQSFSRWLRFGGAAIVAALLGLGVAQRHVSETENVTEAVPRLSSTWRLQATTFEALGGAWRDYQEWRGAWQAFLASCSVSQRWSLVTEPERYDFLPVAARTPSVWRHLCRQARENVNRRDDKAIRTWLEAHLMPYRFVAGEESQAMLGLFTGYFRPILLGSPRRTGRFTEPIHGVPSDLVVIDGESFASCAGCPPAMVGQLRGRRVVEYPSRGEIMAGAIDSVAPVLAWAQDDIDVFLLSVQGSGKVRLTDGTTLVLRYAARNGHAYKSLARILKERGLWHDERITWPGLRQWLEDNPKKRRSVLADNPLYIFFEEAPEDIGAVGSLGVALEGGHALAVDARWIPLGLPLWVTTTHPLSTETWSQLMMAQDTGSAVKGVVRGDIFWGEGAQAEISAGLMNYQGSYVILLPKPSAIKSLEP